jgi:DNA-binding transcriptional MerR regulator
MMIPNKSNFKFQELTPITGVKPYVIRFWETEFPEIAPVISDSGQKLYARKDVEAILKVKKLLFDEKLTIPEAKMMMSGAEFDADGNKIEVVKVDIKPMLIDALELIKVIKARRNW